MVANRTTDWINPGSPMQILVAPGSGTTANFDPRPWSRSTDTDTDTDANQEEYDDDAIPKPEARNYRDRSRYQKLGKIWDDRIKEDKWQ